MSYSLFSVFGIEIEYAIVRRDTLTVDASVDRLIQALAGSPNAHPSFGNVETDNELAAHVLELKCLQPTQDLVTQAQDFAAAVKGINQTLNRWNARLLPSGMHPFMDPAKESILWPHEDQGIYQAYDRIFGCRGHGWFNIQSVHLNLPFANDAEFSRLHNAISLLLPILPALAAASPIFDGQHNGWLDGRLFHYVGNQRRLPSIIGGIIPEPVGSEEEYQEKILRPMYRDIAPLDPDDLLQEEWLNSRAAIARFDRGAIEIRCLDTQERPLADLALCHFVTSVLKMMLDSDQDFLALHRQVPEGLLKSLFLDTAHYGMAAKIPAGYPIDIFGLEFKDKPRTTHDLLTGLTTRVRAWTRSQSQSRTESQSKDQSQNHFPILPVTADAYFMPAIDLILERGNLSERILKASLGAGSSLKKPQPELYASIYSRLGDCLEFDQPFLGLA